MTTTENAKAIRDHIQQALELACDARKELEAAIKLTETEMAWSDNVLKNLIGAQNLTIGSMATEMFNWDSIYRARERS